MKLYKKLIKKAFDINSHQENANQNLKEMLTALGPVRDKVRAVGETLEVTRRTVGMGNDLGTSEGVLVGVTRPRNST